MKYIPFLKLKINELGALNKLEDELLENLIPFFDIAKPSKLNWENVEKVINDCEVRLSKDWGEEKKFYIDSYDIPDSIRIRGMHVYQYLLNKFLKFNFIPVVGINRNIDHNNSAFEFIKSNNIQKVAIRFNIDDFLDYKLIEEEFLNLLNLAEDNFRFDIIFDYRYLKNIDNLDFEINQLKKFLKELKRKIDIDNVIVTGSSVSANISDHLDTKQEQVIARLEWVVYNKIKNDIKDINLIYGDYGIISPNYSDSDFDVRLIQNVASPKLFYTTLNEIHIFRGGAFKSHPRGRYQYFDLAKKLVNKNYFRGQYYSYGDSFIFDKSKNIGSPSSQGHWYQMLNNSHMTYIFSIL
jgi:hypothetical protein